MRPGPLPSNSETEREQSFKRLEPFNTQAILRGVLFDGGGRAPTEELLCIKDDGFCSTGAAGDGRAPTEELSCVKDDDFCSKNKARF